MIARDLELENKQCIQKFMELCNLMGNEDALAEQFQTILQTEHRTIQQIVIGIMKQVIEDHGSPERAQFTDLRNEASRKWAKKVRQISAEDPYSVPGMRFPFI